MSYNRKQVTVKDFVDALPKDNVIKKLPNGVITNCVAHKDNNPSLVYDENLKMVTTFEKKRNTWVLDFVITYNAESVDERKVATEKLVEVPLSDMRAIRKIVESVLETFTVDCDLNFMVDCVSFIRSETTAKCEPITIEKVMGNE